MPCVGQIFCLKWLSVLMFQRTVVEGFNGKECLLVSKSLTRGNPIEARDLPHIKRKQTIAPVLMPHQAINKNEKSHGSPHLETAPVTPDPVGNSDIPRPRAPSLLLNPRFKSPLPSREDIRCPCRAGLVLDRKEAAGQNQAEMERKRSRSCLFFMEDIIEKESKSLDPQHLTLLHVCRRTAQRGETLFHQLVSFQLLKGTLKWMRRIETRTKMILFNPFQHLHQNSKEEIWDTKQCRI